MTSYRARCGSCFREPGVRPGEPGRAQRVRRRIGGKSQNAQLDARQPRNRSPGCAAYRFSGAFQQSLRPALKLKPRVLMRLAASNRSDALHEIKDAFRLAVFLAQDGFDDFRGLGFGKPAPPKEGLPVLVRAGNDPLPSGLDTGDEWRG